MTESTACDTVVCLVPTEYKNVPPKRIRTPLSELQIVRFGDDSPPFWLIQLNSYSRTRMTRPPSSTWEEGFGSWFIGTHLVSDGGIYYAIPFDPCFLAIPLLYPPSLEPGAQCPARSLSDFFEGWPHLQNIGLWQRPGESHATWAEAAQARLAAFCDCIKVINSTVVRLKVDHLVAWLLAKTLAMARSPAFRRMYHLPPYAAAPPSAPAVAADDKSTGTAGDSAEVKIEVGALEAAGSSDGAAAAPPSAAGDVSMAASVACDKAAPPPPAASSSGPLAGWPRAGATAADPDRAAVTLAVELVGGFLPDSLAEHYAKALGVRKTAAATVAAAAAKKDEVAADAVVAPLAPSASFDPKPPVGGVRGAAAAKGGRGAAASKKLAAAASGCKPLTSFFGPKKE